MWICTIKRIMWITLLHIIRIIQIMLLLLCREREVGVRKQDAKVPLRQTKKHDAGIGYFPITLF